MSKPIPRCHRCGARGAKLCDDCRYVVKLENPGERVEYLPQRALETKAVTEEAWLALKLCDWCGRAFGARSDILGVLTSKGRVAMHRWCAREHAADLVAAE